MWRRVGIFDLLLIGFVALVAAALLAGFVSFVRAATHEPAHDHGKADAIVVLTGGGSRLGEAGQLLRGGFGRRLLISGTNPKVRREDLERLTGLDGTVFKCCVDVGYSALDTIGNAGETKAWARAHGFRHLIVVTASYHMPRSLAELHNAAPHLKLSPHSVVPRELAGSSWWRDVSSLRVLAGEYIKYVSASARMIVERLIAGDSASMAEGARSKAMADR